MTRILSLRQIIGKFHKCRYHGVKAHLSQIFSDFPDGLVGSTGKLTLCLLPDIVTDFRPGGCGRSVHVDGVELAPRNGVWEVAG